VKQVSIAAIHEQRGALHRFVELTRGGAVLVGRQGQLVGVHHVDLERDARRPRAAGLGRWDAAVKEQGSLRAGPCLSQHLSGQNPQREAGIDEAVGQAIGGEAAALNDRAEAGFLRVAHTVGGVGEGLALVEIWSVHDVSRRAKSIGKGEAPGRQTLCVMKEQDLRHADQRR
jgi:hypothetical protein